MRKLSLISSLALILLFTAMYACTLDPAGDPPRTEAPSAELGSAQLDDPSVSATATTTDEASIADPVDDAVNPRASCSVVQFCNAPGSDGTVCEQQGCSLATARAECRAEVKTVCGTRVCPFEFVTTAGQRFLDSSCCSSGVACGDHCCSAGQFCGLNNNTCCDGIHFNSACPPS